MNTRAGFHLAIRSLSVFVAMAMTALAAHAQQAVTVATPGTAVAGNYSVVARAPDSRIWQWELILTNAGGGLTTNFQSYTEIGTGICYLPEAGTNFVDTVEEVDAVADGAQAVQGRHRVQWSLNGNTPAGAVTITTPDSRQLSCTVFGMAYYDAASGSNAAIALLQDWAGTTDAPNQMI